MSTEKHFSQNELEKFKLALEHAPIAVFIMDKNWNFEYINPEFEKLSGFNRDDLLHKNISETLYKNVQGIPESRSDIVASLNEGKSWKGELLTINHNGSKYWAETTASPYKNEQGEIQGYIVIQQDVTERKKMITALKEREQLHETLIGDSQEGVIITQDFKFLYINRVFSEMVGYSFEELNDLNPASIIAPEDRERVSGYHAMRMRGENAPHSYFADFIRKDGSRFSSEITSSGIEIGGKKASFISMRDITERVKMENALRESEKKYRALVENSLDGIMIVNNDKILFANNSLCNMLGYEHSEILGSLSTSYLHPNDKLRALATINRRKETGSMPQKEYYQFVGKDDQIIDCELISSIIEYEGDLAVFITIHNLTESKRMQEALARSERRFRELTEMLPQAIYELDANNQPLFMNRAGLKMFGIKAGDGKGRKAYQFFTPEDSKKMQDALLKEAQNVHYENGIMQPFASEPVEYTAYRADGSSFPVIIYGTPIIENDLVVGSRGIIIDISERKAIENALRESEKKYKTLVENSLDGIMIVRNNQILFANDTYCNMLGYNWDFISKAKATDFIVPEERDRAIAVSKLRMRGDKSTIRDSYRLMCNDGKIIECEIYSSVIDYEGQIASFFTIHDVTESRRLQRAIEEKEALYRTLIEKTQDGVVLTQNRKFYMVNQSFCNIFGYTREEIMAMNPIDLLAPEYKEQVLIKRDKRMRGEMVDSMNYLVPFIHKSGDRLIVEMNSTIVQIEGQNLSFVTLRDVTKRNQLQEALRESEQKYRELTELLPQTVYELDLNANLRYLNKAGREKFGTAYESSEVSVFSIVVPDQRERMKRNFNNVSFENIPSKGNFYQLQQANGQVFEAMISANPMVVDGKTVGSRGVVIDISDHVAMQKALAESEEKYRSLIENATDGIVITQNGLLKFTNQAMCEMMGYTAEEIQDRSFYDFVVKEDHEVMQQFHKRRMTGESINALYRSRFIKKDGKIITVELNTRTSYYNNQPAAFIMIRDISERLSIEEELTKAKNQLETLNKNLEERIKESSESLTEARTQLIRLQKENLQSQFEVLRQQVNPHFLFNSLNVLTSLIKLEPDLAEKFTEHLSKVYRYVLENKDNDLVDLKTELDFLDAYLFLLNIRFMDKIAVTINIENDKTDWLILPLALQLLIENAIKHNSMSKKTPLRIDLFIDENNFLNVENNLQERESYIASTGVGLKNIEHRYKLLEMEPPEFIKTRKSFIAKIPLKENKNNQ